MAVLAQLEADAQEKAEKEAERQARIEEQAAEKEAKAAEKKKAKGVSEKMTSLIVSIYFFVLLRYSILLTVWLHVVGKDGKQHGKRRAKNVKDRTVDSVRTIRDSVRPRDLTRLL